MIEPAGRRNLGPNRQIERIVEALDDRSNNARHDLGIVATRRGQPRSNRAWSLSGQAGWLARESKASWEQWRPSSGMAGSAPTHIGGKNGTNRVRASHRRIRSRRQRHVEIDTVTDVFAANQNGPEHRTHRRRRNPGPSRLGRNRRARRLPLISCIFDKPSQNSEPMADPRSAPQRPQGVLILDGRRDGGAKC